MCGSKHPHRHLGIAVATEEIATGAVAREPNVIPLALLFADPGERADVEWVEVDLLRLVLERGLQRLQPALNGLSIYAIDQVDIQCCKADRTDSIKRLFNIDPSLWAPNCGCLTLEET